ncbi:MAG TPA: hypothetical protein PKG69_04325 [Methanoregulaceae archaeon]|nr:hypothetical protein [Methanoregulaceae archaeon]
MIGSALPGRFRSARNWPLSVSYPANITKREKRELFLREIGIDVNKITKKDRGWVGLPDSIRYLFYQNVVSQIGVPNNRPVIANAWSTANIDATLIV